MSDNPSRTKVLILKALAIGICLGMPLAAATTEEPARLSVGEAISLALKNYPAIRVAKAKEAAARAGIGLAKIAYLPRADLLMQENRATRNNVSGLLAPQSVIPPIGGPVLPDSNSSTGAAALAHYSRRSRSTLD